MNPYHQHIIYLFSRMVELQHQLYNIQSLVEHSNKSIKYTEDHDFISGSHLVISDWTGPTDHGWEINKATGISMVIRRKDYRDNLDRLISAECCYNFAQCFEALEKYFKDCILTKCDRSIDFNTLVNLQLKNNFKRENLKSKDIYEFIKKASKPYLSDFSEKNNQNIKFKEFWKIISEARHAITHSSSKLKITKIPSTNYYEDLFDLLFIRRPIDEETILIHLDFYKCKKLQKLLSEFAFQVFKALSKSEKLSWNIIISTAHK